MTNSFRCAIRQAIGLTSDGVTVGHHFCRICSVICLGVSAVGGTSTPLSCFNISRIISGMVGIFGGFRDVPSGNCPVSISSILLTRLAALDGSELGCAVSRAMTRSATSSSALSASSSCSALRWSARRAAISRRRAAIKFRSSGMTQRYRRSIRESMNSRPCSLSVFVSGGIRDYMGCNLTICDRNMSCQEGIRDFPRYPQEDMSGIISGWHRLG